MKRHIHIHIHDVWNEGDHPRAANGEFGERGKKAQALYEKPGTPGEKAAAKEALKRIKEAQEGDATGGPKTKNGWTAERYDKETREMLAKSQKIDKTETARKRSEQISESYVQAAAALRKGNIAKANMWAAVAEIDIEYGRKHHMRPGW